MRPHSQNKKYSSKNSEISPTKSISVTTYTSRPSTCNPRMKSLNKTLKTPVSESKFVFQSELETQSVPIKYLFDKATTFYYQSDYKAASKTFSKALELNKNLWKCWNNLGVSYLMLNNLNEGLNSFYNALSLDNSIESLYYNISLAFFKFDKLKEAVICIKSSKSILEKPSEWYLKHEKYLQDASVQKQKSILGINSYKIHVNSNFSTPTPTRATFFDRSARKNDAEKIFNYSIGLNQEEIVTKRSILTPGEENTENLKVKIKKLKEKLSTDMKNLLKKPIPRPTKLESKFITHEELQELKNEYKKPNELRNYEKINLIAGKLEFFKKFNEETRQKLYEIGKIKFYKQDDIIFNQGDTADSMYVILKGAVSIEKQEKSFGSTPIVINSIYDGKQFGELALINSVKVDNKSNERAATCKACEKTYLLCIPKEDYSEILLMCNKEDLDYKINFFSRLSMFRNVNKTFLFNLATNIDAKNYKLNDVILAKGEIPKGLYIISYGCAVLFTEGYTIKHKYNDEYSPVRNQRPKPPPLYFSLSPPSKPIKNPLFDQSPVLETYQNQDSSRKDLSKFLSKKQIKDINEENTLVQDRMPFATLQELDFFGGRAILEGSYGKSIQNSPSKFSIVVQSSRLQVFVITKYHLQFLNHEMTAQLLTVLEKSYEIDCPPSVNAEEMDNLLKNWQKFKSSLIKNTRKENFVSKHRNNFPFY
jgi:tetratricopeptide (TPR) repeat protein